MIQPLMARMKVEGLGQNYLRWLSSVLFFRLTPPSAFGPGGDKAYTKAARKKDRCRMRSPLGVSLS